MRRCVAVALACAVLAGCGGDPPRPRPTHVFGPGTHILAIERRDAMSESFVLIRAAVSVDGQPVYTAGSEDAQEALPDTACVYRAPVTPGDHEVTVELLYRGQGYGVFSYLSGYRFAVRGTTTASMPSGAAVVQLVLTGVEEGGATAPLEDRPKVRFASALAETDTNAGCFP